MKKTEMKSLTVLYIEDNRGDVILLKGILQDFPHIQVVEASDLQSAISWLRVHQTDVVLLDLGLPDTAALSGLTTLKSHFPELCIVVLSGNEDFKVNMEAVNQGAQDFILKSRIGPEYIYKTLFQAHERNALFQELRRKEEELTLNQERLQMALRAGKIGVLDWNMETGAVVVDGTYFEVIGHSPEKYVPSLESFSNILYPEDREHSLSVLSEIHKGKINHLTERYRLIDEKGHVRWIENNGQVLYKNGKPERLVSMIRNITKKIQSEQKVLRATVKAQEGERARISSDIHDGLQQLLVATMINLETVSSEMVHLSDFGQKRLVSCREQLQLAIEETRQIAHDLMPKAINDFGLVGVLNTLCQSAGEKLNISFYENLKSVKLPPEIEITLYRIAQQAINNIVKHAHAKSATIQLLLVDHKVTLTIEDDGEGFDVNHTWKTLGLQSMKTRAQAVGGLFEVDSSPEKGTNILVEVSILELPESEDGSNPDGFAEKLPRTSRFESE